MGTLTDLLLYLPAGTPPPDQSFTLATAVVGAVGYGPGPTVMDGTTYPPISAHLLDYTFAEVVEFDQSKGRQWIDIADDAGSGQLTVANTDPDLAFLASKQLVQFRLYGSAAFTMLARSYDKVMRDRSEEVAQLTQISGPGHIARFEKSRVQPSRGWDAIPKQTERLFSWPSPEFNDSSWVTAEELVSVADAKPVDTGTWPTRPMGNGFPDSAGAFMIWAPGTPTVTPYASAVGDCYFRTEFTTVSDGNVILYLLIDNYGDVYIDGQAVKQVSIGDGYINVTTLIITLNAGPHTLAVHAINVTEGSPGGLAVAIYDADASGAPVAGSLPLVVSDSSWKILAYPTDPIGMTAGEIANVLFDEWETALTSPTIARNWTDELDAKGNPWEVIPGFTTRVGNDGFTVLARELGGTYVDVQMWPSGWELSLYRIGERGRNVDVTYHGPTSLSDPSSGNLLGLTAKGELEPITGLAVEWRDGWIEVWDEDAAAVYGRNMDTLGLTASSEGEAIRIAREQLVIFARERAEIGATIRDEEASRPYATHLVADWVLCEQEPGVGMIAGTTARERVLSMSVSEDDDGTVKFVPAMRDLVREAEARHERAIKKIGLGTLDGRSDVANPVSSISGSGGPTCCAPEPTVGGGGGG